MQDFLRSENTELLKGKVKTTGEGGLVLETPRGDVGVKVEDTTVVASQAGSAQAGDLKEGDTVMVFSKDGEAAEVTAVAVWIIPSEAS